MKKLILGFFMCFFLVSNAHAVEIGLGIDLMSFDFMSYGTKVFVPLDVTPSFRIEPHLLYFNDEGTTVSSSGTSTSSLSETELGFGFFGIQRLNQQTRLYYGARLAYVSREDESISPTSTSTTDYDGFRFSPTWGFEHYFSENVSFGGEISWYYTDLDMDRFSTFSGTSTGSDEMTGTDSEIIVRYYF
jgi:hypothetical protein